MANQELVAHIRQQLLTGMAPADIKAALMAAGWTESDINEGFGEVGRTTTPLQSPQPPVPPAAQAPASSFENPATLASYGSPGLKSKRRIWMILGMVGLVVVGGGAAYAYLMRIGPFSRPPYSENNLVSGLLLAASRINTSTYALSGSLSVGARDADAKPYVSNLSKSPDFIQRYQHDAQRARDANAILENLRSRQGALPSSLQIFAGNDAGNDRREYYRVSSINDPVTNQPYGYARTDNGKNFTLTITFETDAAISQLKRTYDFSAAATSVEGRRITFTKDSSSYFYLPAAPPKPMLAQLGDAVGSLPPEVTANVSASAATDWGNQDAGWKFNISANGDFGDLSYKFDVDALKKNSTYYFKINNLPSLFLGSLATIKGEWIKVDSSAASSSQDYYFNVFSSIASQLPEAEKSYKERWQELTDAIKKAAAIADEEHLLTLKNAPGSERVDGRLLYRYDLKINKDAIVPFYKRLVAETDVSKLGGSLIADEGYIEYLQSPEFSEIFDYYDSNTSVTLWADSQGFPGMLSYSLRVIPLDTATQLEGKQVNIVFTLTLSNINEPVDIQEPSNAKPIQDLIKQGDARRVADTKQIQLALELYFDSRGGYPTALAKVADANACGGSPCIPVLPTDPSDKTSYSYTYRTDSSGKVIGYHLGASLEDPLNVTLSSDRDCNSATGKNCDHAAGFYKATAFDGTDAAGCHGEKDRACYDVEP